MMKRRMKAAEKYRMGNMYKDCTETFTNTALFYSEHTLPRNLNQRYVIVFITRVEAL